MPSLSTSDSITETANNLHELLRFYRRVLQRGWWLIALSAAACLMLAAIYLATTDRMYEASARLLILKHGSRPLNVAGNDTGEAVDREADYVPTQAQIMSSPLVVGRAVESIGLARLPTLAAAERKGLDPVGAAIDQLEVERPDRQAKILRVSYWARSREEALRTLGAIVASYQKIQEGAFQKKSDQTIRLITRARDELKEELERLQAQYREFRQENRTLVADGTGRPFVSLRLEQLYRAANEGRIKELQLRAQLELARKLAQQGTGLWAIAHAAEHAGPGSSSSWIASAAGVNQGATQDYIRQLNQEQQKLSERYGPENAKVQAIQEQIQRVQEESHNARRLLEQGEVQDLLRSYEQGLRSVEGLQAELDKEYESELSKLKGIEDKLLVESNLRERLDRHRSLYNTVVDQLNQAKFVGDYSSVSSEVIEPSNSLRLRDTVKPRLGMTLGLALVAGVMLGTIAAVVTGYLDPRIQTLPEIRKAFDLPILGQIPRIPDAEIGEDGEAGLAAQASPRSIWAESYRTLRTNVEFRRRNRKFNVVLVTSPRADCGTSTSASNLAISLAQAGRRVLLIDGDLRQPSLHRIHKLKNRLGLGLLLNDLIPTAGAIQPSSVEKLDVITSGPSVANPAELLGSPRLAKILDEARRSYDMVIVDSSPLLDVADPAIIGASVDEVLLVVNAQKTSRGDAQQAMEMLRSMESRIVGIVVNKVDDNPLNFDVSEWGDSKVVKKYRDLMQRLISRDSHGSLRPSDAL